MQKSIKEIQGLFKNGLDTARRLGAPAAKFLLCRSESVSCSFENARLKTASSEERFSYSVTTVVDGRRGVAAGNDFACLDQMIERSVALAKVGSVAHFDAYPAASETAKVKTYSERTKHLSREKLTESCQTIVNGLKEYDPELFIEASGGRSISERVTVTSGGVCHHSRSTGWGIGGGVQRTEDSDMLFARSHRGWRDVNEYYDTAFVLDQILTDLRNAETIAEAPKGRVTALIDPYVLSMFLHAITLGASGRNVAKGDSPLRGRLGEQILDSCMTILDDPHWEFSSGACEMDDNGVPTRVNEIVKDGALQMFLYDLDSAGLAGAEATGNNGCSPYSLHVLPGDRPRGDLLASIDDGIYIKSLIGFGQSNIMNGDFSCNVALGFPIRNGELVGRVKNTMIAGNVYDLLRRDVELSSDYEDPTHRVPHAVIQGLSVSAQ
ncbi:MAG: TldD/PmbA family protein [Planctomycetes bacterium]|nr:TldD/PmbA family protein [Planctomycetota bacterium]